MPARLILNADDFGLTRGINRAIAELHTAGALTSATLMANGPAFDDAVVIASQHPRLGVGCHIVLTDGVPLSPPHTIPTLLGPDGRSFRPTVADFFLAALRGKVSEDDIEREALAQIQKLQRAGIDVTHIDTHKHTHILPGVARPLLWLAERTSIGCIRNPFEPRWSASISPASVARKLLLSAVEPFRRKFESLPQIAQAHVLTTDGTVGISATGKLNQSTLSNLLAALPNSGTWEIVCHPGYNDTDLDSVTTRLRATREVELAALLHAFAANLPQPTAPELIHYGKLGGFGALRDEGLFFPNTGYENIL